MSGRASAMAGRSSARGASSTSDHNTRRGRRASPPSSRGSAAAPEDSDGGPSSDDLISHPEGKGKGQGGSGGGPTRPRSPGDGDEDEEETLSSSPPAPLPHAAPRKKPRAATITQTMSAAQIADCVTKVCGATMVAALWGTLTARMPAQPMQTLQLRAGGGTSKKGRRSSGGSSTSGGDDTSPTSDAHVKSRLAVQHIFLPVCSAMIGDKKTKYNLGQDKTRTTVGGNAFLHAAFLSTAVSKGQTREEFREEFLRSVTNMRSSWNKEIRQGLRVFCCALFNMVLDMDSNVLEDDEAPADLAELVSESKKLADRMSHREPAVSILIESALARVLKGHVSEYPDFEWVDALDDGKGDTANSFYEYLFKPLVHSALTGINLMEETRDRASGVEPPQLREEAAMKAAAWATLEKGGGAKNASFTEDMWATFLTFWTAKKRPMHGLLKVRLETIETEDLVAFVKPYTCKRNLC